jgi:hypothetical protein
VRAIAPALAVVAALRAAAAGAPAEDALEEKRAAVAKDLMRVGTELRREIERRDTAALLARVPDAGLRCGDHTVPKARLARDLSAGDSWLHGVLFGGPGYAPPPGTAPSLLALLRGPGEVAMVVSFVRDPRAGELGRPCLDFRVKGLGTPGVPTCFEERGGRWWIVDSLYPCG